MIEDEQTHTLPKSEEGLAHVACFAGFDSVADFSRELTARLETVTGHYARLFEREAPLASEGGSLVFTGVEEDPETLETLTSMGSSDPASCLCRHSRLASRPHPRHAQRAGARAADQADARVARSACQDRRSRCGIRAVRPLSQRVARGRAVVLHAACQSAFADADRRNRRLRAAPRHASCAVRPQRSMR